MGFVCIFRLFYIFEEKKTNGIYLYLNMSKYCPLGGAKWMTNVIMADLFFLFSFLLVIDLFPWFTHDNVVFFIKFELVF